MRSSYRTIFGIAVLSTAWAGLFLLASIKDWALGGWVPVEQHQAVAELSRHSTVDLACWGALGFTCVLGWMLAAVGRWLALLEAQGLHLPFAFLLRSWLTGSFYGLFLPGGLGRDAYRFYDSGKSTGRFTDAGTALVAEKAVGLIAFVAVTLLCVPLGFWALGTLLARIRLGILAAAMIAVALAVGLALLRPSVVRTAASLPPWPRAWRIRVERLASAWLAYAESPRTILLAILYGMAGHMFLAAGVFCVLTLLRAPGVSAARLLLISPLMRASGLLSCTVAWTTIPQHVFKTWLDGSSVAAIAAAYGLAWLLVSRFLPAVLGLIAGAGSLLLRARRQLPQPAPFLRCVFLEPEETTAYRSKLIDCLLAGMAGGFLAGATAGLLEATWLYWHWMAGSSELRVFWWAPLTYGLTFSLFGLGMAMLFAYLYVAFGRFRAPAGTLALCMGSTLAALVIIIGRYRFARDVLGDDSLNSAQTLALFGVAALMFLIVERAAALTAAHLRMNRVRVFGMTTVLYVGMVTFGAAFGLVAKAEPMESAPIPRARTESPNIILIVADTLRADYVSAINPDSPAQTPNLDAFAEDAVVFPECYAQGSWTKPSSASLFTGLYMSSHGVTGKASIVPEEATTLAERLHSHGYYTKGFANNRNMLAEYGYDQGFVDYEFLEPRLYFGATLSVEPLALYQVLRRVRLRLMAPKIDIDHFYRPAEGVNEAALTWLDEGRAPNSMPFFLFLHYMDPHDPYRSPDIPGAGYTPARLGLNPDPEVYLDPMREAYRADVEYMDGHLGTLFEELRRRGLYENSIIVFTADHGEEFYEHQGWCHGPTLYEEVVHVPLMIKLPAAAHAPGETGPSHRVYPHAGEHNQNIARTIDVAPTLLELARLPGLEGVPGIPLIDRQGAFLNAATTYSFAETDFLDSTASSVRTFDWKVIRTNEHNPRGLQPLEIYHVGADPEEHENLAGQERTARSVLEEELREIRAYAEENTLL